AHRRSLDARPETRAAAAGGSDAAPARHAPSRRPAWSEPSPPGTRFTVTHLELEQAPRRVGEPGHGRNVVLLELPVRIGDVVTGHAEDGAPQVEDRLLREDRRDLGRVATRPGGLLHDHRTPRLRDGREQRLLVE